jgi:hypothetical protein
MKKEPNGSRLSEMQKAVKDADRVQVSIRRDAERLLKEISRLDRNQLTPEQLSELDEQLARLRMLAEITVKFLRELEIHTVARGGVLGPPEVLKLLNRARRQAHAPLRH